MIEVIRGIDKIKFVKFKDNWAEVFDFIESQADQHILWLEFRNQDASFINQLVSNNRIRNIKRIHFSDDSEFIHFFSDFSHFTSLSFGFDHSVFDFSKQQSLIELGGVWSKNWKSLEVCSELKTFHVSAYHAEIEQLPNIAGLKELVFIQPKFSDVKGIEQALALEKFEISYASKLVDISHFSINNKNLKKLWIEKCKKISSYEAIMNLKSLEHLSVLHCTPIQSLGFLSKLEKLDFLNVYGTNVHDLESLQSLASKFKVHGLRNK